MLREYPAIWFRRCLAGGIGVGFLTAVLVAACGGNDGTVDTRCTGGACELQCSTDTACPSGYVCGPSGSCAPSSGAPGDSPGDDVGTIGPGDTGASSGDTGTTGAGESCASLSVGFERAVPNVLLLVDRSGSMRDLLEGEDEDDPDAIQRWTAVRSALVNPASGLVPSLQSKVNFGLTMYTTPPERDFGESCPYLIEVPIAPDNYDAIAQAYQPEEMGEDDGGRTPTGQAIEAVIPRLSSLDPAGFPGPKVLVLATDGEPNSCEGRGGGQGSGVDERGRAASVQAVQHAFESGVVVYVISVGDEVGVEHLHELANAGQGMPLDDPTPRYFPANDVSQLESAFETIIGNVVRDCVFTLDGQVQGDGSAGTVLIDGTAVVIDDPNGWRLNSPTEVEFLGAACETVKSGEHQISITFPCDEVIPVPR
ncbi:vWA domain-containing protein [Sorangium sp. So ce233]|uniref:vWA domain-containing protein n=1 Tax=Sorangium sp. So ce233 TaxID=3133290 RepID=UPI003F61866D